MAKNKKRNKSELEYKPLEWYYFVPILLVVGLIPLITFGKVVNLQEIEVVNWKGGETSIDFFSYYKAVFFAIFSFTSAMLLVLLKMTNQFKFKITKYYIPIFIYILGVLFSYVLSPYQTVAYRGFVEQFQGVFVMIGYALMIFSIYNYVDKENQVKLILYGFIFSASIAGLIGVGQYFGADLFKTMFGRYLILPDHLHQIAESLKFTFSEYTIYSTMYNTNFVGSFAALLLPMAIFLFLYTEEKKYKILSFAFSVLMMMTWIGSNSRAGYLGFSFGLVFMLILYRKKLKKDIKKIGALVAALLVIVVVMNTVSDGRVLSQFSRLNPVNEGERLETIQVEDTRYEDIKFEGNSVTFVTNKETLKAELDGNQLMFFDEKNEKIPIEIRSGNIINFKDDRYEEYQVKLEDDNRRFIVTRDGIDFAIYFTQDGLMMAGASNVLKKTEYPPKLDIFDGRERFASSRGYIWSRTIPMLKDTVIIGHGPDTYSIEFPQYDYVGKLNSFPNHRMIVDKPHNMYLQIGINTGLMSLLALLALYLMYFIDSMKIYFKRDINSFLEYVGLGAFTGIMAYLAAGVFNDQIISVAPLFYSMVGLGLAVNRLVKKQEA
jgi:O-antigen ligase